MSTKATAARIYEYGEPDVFRFETMDVPDPVGHEVLVRNTVIGLNFVDIYYRRGTLPVPKFPAIIGDEASGVVEAVGPSVTLVKVGDRVAYADAFGAYTTVRLYPEDRLTVIPDGVTDDQAASSLLKGLTARYLLKETVQLHEGDTVLYHAAAGGRLGGQIRSTCSSSAASSLTTSHALCSARFISSRTQEPIPTFSGQTRIGFLKAFLIWSRPRSDGRPRSSPRCSRSLTSKIGAAGRWVSLSTYCSTKIHTSLLSCT
jgi:hypothetical protein